jgi:phage-related protein
MLNLKLSSVIEKNRIQQSEPWLVLLDIVMPSDIQDVLRVVNNVEAVTYQGLEYIPFNFMVDDREEASQGGLPTFALRASNVNGILQGALEDYDGGVGAVVTFRVVHNKNMSGDPDLEESFTILSADCDAEYVTFTLGGENPMRKLFPLFFYTASRCRHVYNTPAMQAALDPRGVMCGYQGSMTTCSHILSGDTGCRAHNNVINFGGQYGIDITGFRRAMP